MAKKPDLAETRWPPLNSELPGNFWLDNNGRNTLKGVPDDPDNLPVLPDFHIVHALQRTQKAHDDLQLLLPNLLPEEQERLNAIVAENPFITKVVQDQTVDGDEFQSAMNRRIPVYFAGRFRGAGRRHNVIKNTLPPTTKED